MCLLLYYYFTFTFITFLFFMTLLLTTGQEGRNGAQKMYCFLDSNYKATNPLRILGFLWNSQFLLKWISYEAASPLLTQAPPSWLH